MNKEEIKEYIKEQIDKCYIIEHMNFEKVDLSKLLDYITNLQEEIQKKDAYIKYLNERTTIKGKVFYGDAREVLQDRINKAIEYIEENCIKSDKWEDLGFCNFVPTGKISYNSLSVKKVKELLNILKGEE